MRDRERDGERERDRQTEKEKAREVFPNRRSVNLLNEIRSLGNDFE